MAPGDHSSNEELSIVTWSGVFLTDGWYDAWECRHMVLIFYLLFLNKNVSQKYFDNVLLIKLINQIWNALAIIALNAKTNNAKII